MEKVKELKSEIPEFNPETHKWDRELKKVVELTPKELAEIARRKRKADLEKRFKPLIANNVYYQKAFGVRYNGQYVVSEHDEIAEWDRDDLDDFEQKVLKMEAVKKEMDDEAARVKPMEDRRNEYQKIDHLFLEALAESGGMIVDGVEKPSEKMQAYLKLRDEIKARFPK
tara:strand:+ start:2059 stop:2568 length:510 start_codon:yes stop_codon:yes gene_type:complete